METERWKKLRRLFEEAIELSSDERREFVRGACAGDEELAVALESLLAEDEARDGFLDPPRSSELFGEGAADAAGGQRVGAYRLEDCVGSGGMGRVYLARRVDEHFRKRVAVKLIKRGMDTEEVLRRFRDERQVLADLEHPGIARLIDGGITQDGLPYLVMEYVEGKRIDQYCDVRELGVPERLRLFRSVCEAVQHAHEHLVVHRDLKPSNILVTSDGLPKLLDFGIAKVLDEASSSATVDVTATEMRMMTPDYAAPEQLSGTGITPATDVYSLGVILYELLTGRRPYRWTTRLRADLERVICDEIPPPPSSVVQRPVGQQGEPAPTSRELSARRGAETTRKLRTQLSGDLDTIVLMALRKEPERRYANARELAEDIERTLEGRPVLAQPDTWRYRARKFVLRNRLLVAAVAAVILSLSVGLVAVYASRRELRVERDNVMLLSAFQELEDLSGEADRLWPAHPEMITSYEDWLARAKALVESLGAHRAQLAALRARSVPAAAPGEKHAAQTDAEESPGFADVTDRWWHNQLAKLVGEIEAFSDPEEGLIDGLSSAFGWGVARRKRWAERVAELTLDGEEARERWARAIASIADTAAAPAYGGLEITSQVGLLPVGPDPTSGLWEFALPQTGEPPVRDAAGNLRLTEDSALVFVLIPGGRFWMGAQDEERGANNFDPSAAPNSQPVHRVALSPFFLSKYEVSQGQWLRATGGNPSYYTPADEFNGRHLDLTHPVENIDWVECMSFAGRLGLTLPSEAQWEYAVRAGTDTVWWTGNERESLIGAANLADRSAARAGANWSSIADWPELDDGFGAHAPVDACDPNAFGLHHMSGNVWEWCLDFFAADFYARSPEVDPACLEVSRDGHVQRGGSFANDANSLRVGLRHYGDVDATGDLLGFRPARPLDVRR